MPLDCVVTLMRLPTTSVPLKHIARALLLGCRGEKHENSYKANEKHRIYHVKVKDHDYRSGRLSSTDWNVIRETHLFILTSKDAAYFNSYSAWWSNIERNTSPQINPSWTHRLSINDMLIRPQQNLNHSEIIHLNTWFNKIKEGNVFKYTSYYSSGIETNLLTLTLFFFFNKLTSSSTRTKKVQCATQYTLQLQHKYSSSTAKGKRPLEQQTIGR